MGSINFISCLLTIAAAADPPVRSDQPYSISFPAEEARFVRLVIRRSSSGEPCVDELEVYALPEKRNLALADGGAKASGSSCLPGYAAHAVEHLNDGRYGNAYSWIPATTGEEWAQIELPAAARIAKVVFSRDRKREYNDRVPIDFEVRVSRDGRNWKTVKKVATTAAAVAVRPRSGRGGFAADVPAAPPPPRVTGAGIVVASAESVVVDVPRKNPLGFANLALGEKARPAASSLLPGHKIHQIAHLNDGLAGNDHSWISATDPSWAEIDLGEVYWVYDVAFGSDSSGRFADRAATTFSILTATQYNEQSKAPTWTTVHRQDGGPAVHTRSEFKFKPVQARWVRIAIDAASGTTPVRIDELEVFGQKAPIAPERIGPTPEAKPRLVHSKSEADQILRYAILGEEHAWLKTYGRADLSPRLVPYNGRVKQYPRHVGEDLLPLPPITSDPLIDGKLGDPCWAEASRGVVRVAYPYDFDPGPLVECAVGAGVRGNDLLLAICTNRLLSSHVAVVSRGDGAGVGVLAYRSKGLVFNRYRRGELEESIPVDGKFNSSLTCCEVRLPLKFFPDCKTQGIRVGLGMGGKHTPAVGRAVNFRFSSLSVAEVLPCRNRTFRVRLAAAPGSETLKVHGNAPGLTEGLTLAAGESKVISIPAQGPIGPQHELTLETDSGESYTLNLFRYDPLERTLTLIEEMLERFAAKRLEVTREREEVLKLRRLQDALAAAEQPDLAAERGALFDARMAKRNLFFRDPDLAPIEKILFVKRHAFEPSHNYSVLLDSRWRPGGTVCRLDIPYRDRRLEPDRAEVVELFSAGEGVARNPMANFDLTEIYFGYRPSVDGYYHIMRMDPDGSNLTQLTDGPFHDYWPCPLPDGEIAFISTRCKARYLCWRPQAAVMFRMNANGENLRPLSYANLSEWAPSVMTDGRIIWTRSEYIDKGADFSHTLWTIRPDGTKPELVFGNTIIQPNGYANGRQVPESHEICCTLISHFGDLNGPIALLDINRGRFNPTAISSITPEVPWPGNWPIEECFRDPVPVSHDYFLCAHAPRRKFALYVIDRFGNREMLHLDETYGSMCPTLYRKVTLPPVLRRPLIAEEPDVQYGQFTVADVYQGIEPTVKRGTVKYIRVVQELRAELIQMPDGSYQKDHEPFMHWYATPVDKVSGPYGWPSYVAKATWGLVPVEKDGSANFYAPAGKVLYFEVLDEDFNELQRMRSVVQLQPGETRSCIGCHEDRRDAPPVRQALALRRKPSKLQPPPWGAGAFSYERVVQPVWDANCAGCHDANDKQHIDLTARLDDDRVPASYRTLIAQGWIHYLDWGYNSGGNEKAFPLTFGTVKSKLWTVLEAGHHDVRLTNEEQRRIKCWTDLNCPLWPDYIFRENRPGPKRRQLTKNN